MALETLDHIGLKTGTDQASCFHDYCKRMDEILAPIRHEPVVFMEQGVLGGAGLEMWSRYFDCPAANIIGIDPEIEKCRPINDPRVHAKRLSQTDLDGMFELGKKFHGFTVVCDDGSHFASQQIAAFNIVWPMIRPGGMWLCQDLHTAWSPQHCDASQTIMQFLHGLTEQLMARGAEAQAKNVTTDIADITFSHGFAVIRKAL